MGYDDKGDKQERGLIVGWSSGCGGGSVETCFGDDVFEGGKGGDLVL